MPVESTKVSSLLVIWRQIEHIRNDCKYSSRKVKDTYRLLSSFADNLTDLASLLDDTNNIDDTVRLNRFELSEFDESVFDLGYVFGVGALWKGK
jgi:hypothetical protein